MFSSRLPTSASSIQRASAGSSKHSSSSRRAEFSGRVARKLVVPSMPAGRSGPGSAWRRLGIELDGGPSLMQVVAAPSSFDRQGAWTLLRESTRILSVGPMRILSVVPTWTLSVVPTTAENSRVSAPAKNRVEIRAKGRLRDPATAKSQEGALAVGNFICRPVSNDVCEMNQA